MIRELELDAMLVEDGVWFTYDTEKGTDREVKVACMEKAAYRNKLGRMMTKALMQSRSREMEATKRDEITYRAMAGTIIMGLRGWKNDAGEEIELTDANAVFILTKWPKVRDFIMGHAGDYDNFIYQEESAEGDNGEQPLASPEARLKSGGEVLP